MDVKKQMLIIGVVVLVLAFFSGGFLGYSLGLLDGGQQYEEFYNKTDCCFCREKVLSDDFNFSNFDFNNISLELI